MFCKVGVVLILALAVVIQAAPISKGKLKFKVSGRNFPDKDTGFGTTDGYFELYVSTDGGRTMKKLTKSDTISDQENPDWGKAFEFDFDRSLNQWWLFKVYDEDNLREDDTVGRTWISVSDYVDKGQTTSARLDKDKGYLIVQSVDKPQPVSASTPLGQLEFPSGTPDTQTLRFKLSAQNLPTKDDVGFIPGNSDPYVIIYQTDGVSGKEKEIGRSATVSSSSNPAWGDIFQVQWDRKKDQRLRFKIYDEDNLREDDKLGVGWLELNDYVAKGQSYVLPLPKRGSITMSKA